MEHQKNRKNQNRIQKRAFFLCEVIWNLSGLSEIVAQSVLQQDNWIIHNLYWIELNLFLRLAFRVYSKCAHGIISNFLRYRIRIVRGYRRKYGFKWAVRRFRKFKLFKTKKKINQSPILVIDIWWCRTYVEMKVLCLY